MKDRFFPFFGEGNVCCTLRDFIALRGMLGKANVQANRALKETLA
jgi:hypothetical protein